MSTTIRAKFVVHSKKEQLSGDSKLVTIEMNPVMPQHAKNPETGQWEIVQNENAKFWQASPSGRLELGCVNLEAAERFESGKEYYLDFTPAN